MSGLGLFISNLYGDIDPKITFFCPLRYVFEASVHFKVRKVFFKAMWKNTMTGNVNFLTQNVALEKHIFEASVHFKVGRSSSRL